MCSPRFAFVATVLLTSQPITGTVIDWSGVANDKTHGKDNTQSLNTALAALRTGDTLRIANDTFWLAGGVVASGLHSVTLQLDGTLRFLPGREGWPVRPPANCNNFPLQPITNKSCVMECIFIANSTNITFTSAGDATIYGSGEAWWGYIKYLIHGENRPRLFALKNVTDVLVEHWRFEQSPYWTFTAYDISNLEVRYCAIDNRINSDDSHGVTNLDAFNTDGFDVAGQNIYIHDSSVWNQDDCFTIQPIDSTGINAKCTENVLVENVNASGLGLTVGAIHPTRGHNCIRNVTFRNAWMHNTFKGIYIKGGSSFDPQASGEITDILYENVVMEEPEQVPIWIGPAQEADSKGACSLLWPELPTSKCPPPPTNLKWTNITLKNIRIISPKESPGLVLGNPAEPMEGLVFDNVVVTPADPSKKPWKDKFYHCSGVHNAIAMGGTSPLPPCFNATIIH